MLDPSAMSDQSLHDYVFGRDPSRGDTIRWSWLWDCLLGDMRTMLVGIRHYQQSATRQIADGVRLGGGNLSVPILVTTGLELISRLYKGARGDPYHYNAYENVRAFVEACFPAASRRMPWLMWTAVRNGLHHAFRPPSVSDGHTTVSFSFVVERGPSVVVRPRNDSFYIIISAPDLVHVLEGAFEQYKADLQRESLPSRPVSHLPPPPHRLRRTASP
jgi:hypothetical protein